MELISREALKKAICEKGIKGYEEYNQGLAAALDLIELAPEIDTSDLISKSALKIAISEATYGFTEIPIRVDKVIALIDSFSTMP